MDKIINKLFFLVIIVLIFYTNKKLNNILGIGYLNLIKYFFVFLSVIFVINPNFDKDYSKFKQIYMS